MRLSLIKKLSIAFLITVLGSLILTSFISNYYVNKNFQQYLVDEHKEKVYSIINLVEDVYSEEDKFTKVNKDEIQRYAEAHKFYISIRDLNNNIIYSSGDAHLQHRNMIQNMMGSMMNNFSTMNLGDYSENDYTLLSNNTNIGTITIGYFGTS